MRIYFLILFISFSISSSLKLFSIIKLSININIIANPMYDRYIKNDVSPKITETKPSEAGIENATANVLNIKII